MCNASLFLGAIACCLVVVVVVAVLSHTFKLKNAFSGSEKFAIIVGSVLLTIGIIMQIIVLVSGVCDI